MPPPQGLFPAIISINVSGNGIVDPGEIIGLELILENLGRPASNITINLESLDPESDVLSGDINIGFIGVYRSYRYRHDRHLGYFDRTELYRRRPNSVQDYVLL
jgi:hypothetical protein